MNFTSDSPFNSPSPSHSNEDYDIDDNDSSLSSSNQSNPSYEDYIDYTNTENDEITNNEKKIFNYDLYVTEADINIKRIKIIQEQNINKINNHFDHIETKLKEQRSKLIETINTFSDLQISQIEECKKRAKIHNEKIKKITGDPTISNENSIDSNAFFEEIIYDISSPEYKIQRFSDDDLYKLSGDFNIEKPEINFLPEPQNIKIIFKSPISGLLEWDKHFYESLFNNLNIKYSNTFYNVNDIKFIFKVNNEAQVIISFDQDVNLKLIPGKKYDIKITAFYGNLYSKKVSYQFIAKEISPEFYKGNWNEKNTLCELNLQSKQIRKKEKDSVPMLFIGDTPLNTDMNNFWAFSYENDKYPEKVFLVGLVPKSVEDENVSVDEGFFCAVQKGFFVSVHSGILLGSESAKTPNGKSCKIFCTDESDTISVGFGAKNKTLIFGKNTADVKENVDDDNKVAYKDLPCDVPLYPAIIVASQSVIVELGYPS